jgi:hypothetical protein
LALIILIISKLEVCLTGILTINLAY